MGGETVILGIPAGDWLQALVTVIALVGTILGTLYIERRNRDAATNEDLHRIREVVMAIQHAAGAIRAGLPDDATNIDHYRLTFAMQSALKSALDMYSFVRADTRIKDLAVWRALRVLDEVVGRDGQTIDNELRTLVTSGHHTAVFNVNRQKVTTASEFIDNAAQGVLKAAN